MSAVIHNDKNEYEKLIKRFPLRPIHNNDENDRAAEVCDALTDRLNSLTPAERDYLEVLTDLISKYESKWDSEIAKMSPRELIAYLMDENGLAQKDLIADFGSASRVSEFLAGTRNLSLEQAKKLSKRFRLNIATLLVS